MHAGALEALEFDRIVAVVMGLAMTPPGREALAALHPRDEPAGVAALQRATSEGTRFLTERSGLPLRAPADLAAILEAIDVVGRALEPTRLLGLADYLESVAHTRSAVRAADASFPVLSALVESAASFTAEIADVRRTIEPSGSLADHASPALAAIRERLRKQKARLRTTLESFLRGRETAKYLQEQVITDRNGRYVLMVRAEHRTAIAGIVHGGSASGASLFVEPIDTVEINNELVALEDAEAEEIRRILLALTDAFRGRPADLRQTIEVATELDVIQARARFSLMVDGVEPVLSTDGTLELRGARHPLLMKQVNARMDDGRADGGIDPVPIDVRLIPPTRILVITGPNTGGKTVALKTAGLLAVMGQAGLHIPATEGSRLPVFRSLFADIGDEQSISASLSTFSAHIANVVAMDQALALPALVLLDEVGAGTDPVEGGALGMAVIDHFRGRGAHLVATTHYDSLKSYASTTGGVASAAFGFDPETFAPTYRLMYGSPGRSLALEIAARLGMPAAVIAAARNNLTEPEKQLAEHLARVDRELRALEQQRGEAARERAALADTERTLRTREEAVRQREASFRKRLETKLDEQLREARREIDAIIGSVKTRAAELSGQAARRVAAGIPTGQTGAARTGARAAVEQVVERLKLAAAEPAAEPERRDTPGTLAPGVRVRIGALGLEGVVLDVHGKHADVDVRGKRLRAAIRDLQVTGGPPSPGSVRVSIDLQPREGAAAELNVIGCTVDDAITRTERFLDESTVTDLRAVRIVHGHGTGQLRRGLAAFLNTHPLVSRIDPAPPEQGGSAVTVVALKD